MTWIILATAAQLIYAVVSLIDKHIVSDEEMLPKPLVYAFYTCLSAAGWIFIFLLGLFPFEVPWISIPSLANVTSPTLEMVSFSILAGYTFFIAIVSLFHALRQADASDVAPVSGAVSAVGSFALGYYFLDSSLSPNFIWGIVLLATGTFLVSRLRFPPRVAMNAIHSGLFFALHWVTIKGLFEITTLDNGIFWSRAGLVFIAISLLLVPSYFEKIKSQTKKSKKSAGLWVLGNKVLAGIATIMILEATELGKVEVVQALGGTQFVFLLFLGFILSKKLPHSFGEKDIQRGSMFQKAVFVSIILFGFFMLFR